METIGTRDIFSNRLVHLRIDNTTLLVFYISGKGITVIKAYVII